MRTINIDRGWSFDYGQRSLHFDVEGNELKKVNLPHDYMIESDTFPEAVSRASSGYYNAGVAHYEKKITIPREWEGEIVTLEADGIMMNATVEINGCKAALQHYGYAPFAVDITPYIYYGEENRFLITVNPSMQPNSRWYSGAGIFRSLQLTHAPKLHIVTDGIYAYTEQVEDGKATVKVQVDIENRTYENRIAEVTVSLTPEAGGEPVIRTTRVQVNPNTTDTAYLTLTVDEPLLWDAENPNLYKLQAEVKNVAEYRTHFLPEDEITSDAAEILFGIRTITADISHGLRINGKVVKLKGGCLHHDNGLLGAVSLYDAEYRKLSKLKEIGYNAVRTTHNPPSAAFMEACDRIGMYVFDEAFDAWGIAKQPGDYNQFFASDWEKDLAAFIRRDRSHPSVVIWSTGNEIPERGGLNNGYTLATRIAEAIKKLDASRPVSNAICSMWSGLDDFEAAEMMKKMTGNMQNADASEDLTWEKYTECFTNGLDIVGYNYMEDRYLRDHEMYPERIILGSENFGNEIGMHWPMIEEHPYMIGDFTWTAYDYIGEAGIGKAQFVDADDPIIEKGHYAIPSHNSEYPWRLANDADVDINGNILPQGDYRHIVWGSSNTYLYSYDPAEYGRVELISRWGFTDGRKSWNWAGAEGKPIALTVFSAAEEVEILLNGEPVARQKAGEHLVHNMPLSFSFGITYMPGKVEAVSYTGGQEVSRDALITTGTPAAIRLIDENKVRADGHGVKYVAIEVVDAEGHLVPDAEVGLTAEIAGDAFEIAGFGSSNPKATENYTKKAFTTYRGRAMAVLRSGYLTGDADLTVHAEGLPDAKLHVVAG